MADENQDQKDGDAKGRPDLTEQARNLAQKHGDASAAIVHLLHEAKGYRDELRDLKGKVPGAGAVVLTADEAAAWAAYRNLGKPEDVKKAVRERDEFAQEVATSRREKEMVPIAEITGYKVPLLMALADRDKVAFVVKEEKRGGEAEKVVHVKGEGDETTPFHEYAEAKWGLKPDGGGKAAGPRGTPTFESNRRPARSAGDRDRDETDKQALRASGRYAL